MKHPTRFLCLLLAMVMMISMAACSGDKETTDPTESTPVATEPQVTMPAQVEVENPVTYFSMSLGESYDKMLSLNAYPNEDGSVHVEYVGDVKKVGDFEPWVLHGIAAELDKAGIAELNGQESYDAGEAFGSMYIEFADGTMLSAGFSGTIPQAYTDGYTAMDSYFAALTANLPVYVPQPLVMGEVDEQLLTEMNTILGGSGIEALDSYTISSVEMDEFFAYTMGLSNTDGIAASASCAPMMMTTAYSLSIVTLEDAAKAADVAADFEANLDWMKWVCVAPSNALIAQKDNMVLCLMAYNELYTQTEAGIQAAGWTVVKTLENPNM